MEAQMVTPALGIPYAAEEVIDGVLNRRCPACGTLIPERTDEDGEKVTNDYAIHWVAAEHTEAEPDATEVTAKVLLDAIRKHTDLPTYCEQTGGGTATIIVYKGEGPTADVGESLILCGPGSYDWSNPDESTFWFNDLYFGPDDGGDTEPDSVTDLASLDAAITKWLPLVVKAREAVDAYDGNVRTNTTPRYDALLAVATCTDGHYGAFGELIDVAEGLGYPVDDDVASDVLQTEFKRAASIVVGTRVAALTATGGMTEKTGVVVEIREADNLKPLVVRLDGDLHLLPPRTSGRGEAVTDFLTMPDGSPRFAVINVPIPAPVVTIVVDCHAYPWHEVDPEYPECGPDNLVRMAETYGVLIEYLPDHDWAGWAWMYRRRVSVGPDRGRQRNDGST